VLAQGSHQRRPAQVDQPQVQPSAGSEDPDELVQRAVGVGQVVVGLRPDDLVEAGIGEGQRGQRCPGQRQPQPTRPTKPVHPHVNADGVGQHS